MLSVRTLPVRKLKEQQQMQKWMRRLRLMSPRQQNATRKSLKLKLTG
jgi:hypothetical protein